MKQQCPCCNTDLIKGEGIRKDSIPYLSAICPNNPRHVRCYVLPPKHKVVDLGVWSFHEAIEELLCPVCSEFLVFKFTKQKQPGIYGTCSDNSDHCRIFLNKPERLCWPYFVNDDHFKNWLNQAMEQK